MALQRHSQFYNPFNIFSSLDDDMHRLNTVMRSLQSMDGSDGTTTLHPNYFAKIREDGCQMIELEMPGVKKENIQIELDHDGKILAVTGNRFRESKLFGQSGKQSDQNGKESETEKKPSHIYKWKGHINGQAGMEDIQAEHLGDGILRILVNPKKEKVGPVRIEIMDN